MKKLPVRLVNNDPSAHAQDCVPEISCISLPINANKKYYTLKCFCTRVIHRHPIGVIEWKFLFAHSFHFNTNYILLHFVPACPYKPADIIFVVDASGSEGANNFNKQLNFIENFTAQFEIGPNNTLVSLVTFATAIKNEFYLDRYSTKPDVLNAIGHSVYLNGETYTHLALDHVRRFNIQPNHGARANVSKIVIVLTDGRSNEEALTKTAAARLKQEAGVTVMAIGIGHNVDPAELTAIASDANHTYRVPDFDALSTIETDLTDTACNGEFDSFGSFMYELY